MREAVAQHEVDGVAVEVDEAVRQVHDEAQLRVALADLVDEGAVRSTAQVHLGSINAANLRRAHALAESGTALGKIVLEMMRMDSTVTDEETATVTSVLRTRFGLTAKELDTLLRFATEEARQAADYYHVHLDAARLRG